MASDMQNKDFFNIFDGTAGRVESSYLDVQERISAEKLRALAEGREPDLSNVGALPGSVGTPMVPKERQVDNRYYSNPSTVTIGERTVDPVATLGVDVGDSDDDVDLSYAAMVARERSAQDEALLADSTASTGGTGAETGASTSTTASADTSTTEFTV